MTTRPTTATTAATTATAADERVLDLRDPRDYATLHQATCGLLLHVAGRLGTARDEREDVAHEAYLRLLESPASFTLAHAKAYLVCAVRSIVIDSRRRAGSRKTSVTADAGDWQHLEGRALWTGDAAHELAVAAVGRALDTMDASSGSVLRLFYRDGLSVKEIQARTGEATGTITAKLCRQRRQCASTLTHAVESALASQPWL